MDIKIMSVVRLGLMLQVLLIPLAVSGPVIAGCIDSTPEANFVAVIKTHKGCGSVKGQFGCRIDGGVGTCTATDPNNEARTFTATSEVDQGVVKWSIDSKSTIGADTALVHAMRDNYACAYSYPSDVVSGSGGYENRKGEMRQIKSVYVCADSKDDHSEEVPSERQVTIACENLLDSKTGMPAIDATGVQCPSDGSTTLVCNIELTDDFGNPVPFFGLNDADSCCVCNRDALAECDPGLPESQGGCPISGDFDKEVTSFIELNNDPYYCRTIGGQRRCFRY